MLYSEIRMKERETGKKEKKSEVRGLNCKHLIVDWDHKTIIEDHTGSIKCKWKINDRNYMKGTQTCHREI